MPIDPTAVKYATNQTNHSEKQVQNVLDLLIEQQCTIPFVTRYRKELTGGLDEIQIENIKLQYEDYLEREKRREYILETLKKDQLLTPELEISIKKAQTLKQLEDLYAPFKSKKKTKAHSAREAGLEPLAKLIKENKTPLDEITEVHAPKFLNPQKKINSTQDAINGAVDILTEQFAHNPEVKDQLRADYWKASYLSSTKKDKAHEMKDYLKFKDYFEFKQLVKTLSEKEAGHRYLAMRRGMTLKILKVEVEYDQGEALGFIRRHCLLNGSNDLLEQSIKKAYTNYIHPSLDLEIKSDLKKTADESAIAVFGVNLKNLLLAPYLGAKCVMGIDPGVRTGCKIVIVDSTGKFIIDHVIYPHPPRCELDASKAILEGMINKFKVENIAIGNGTYGRETLSFVEENVEQVKEKKVLATLISESGASIYSTSEIARAEYPDHDPTVRGAISIAHRFQDPLAELVKIDPKSIGVGQYQHDVNQSRLKKSLTSVVESCVNYVGVDLNTASAPLLSYISGIGPTLAKSVVSYRQKNGNFTSREKLLKVPRFSDKVFEQAAGFLRIYQGSYPLDSTFIHPEQYSHLEKWMKEKNLSLTDLTGKNEVIEELEKDQSFSKLVGSFTHADIVASLKAPSQDPRVEFSSTEFRKDASSIEQLREGEWYPGVVTNITRFGAFVDIGIKENGLVHISEMSDSFVKDALDVLKVGQAVKARILSIDLERKRIALSLKKTGPSLKTSTKNSNVKKKNLNGRPQVNNPFGKLKDFKIKG